MQIHRLFEIRLSAAGYPHITARQLAERFEVSERTHLSGCGCPQRRGHPRLCRQGQGRRHPSAAITSWINSLLNENEQEAILLGLKSLAATGGEDPAVTDKLARLFHKAEASWIEVDFSSWGRDPAEKEAFDILKAAILTARLVHLTYYNAAGEQSERVIEPVRLHFKGGRWYLQAYCRTRQAWRTFRLSRIGRAERLEESFPPRPDGPAAAGSRRAARRRYRPVPALRPHGGLPGVRQLPPGGYPAGTGRFSVRVRLVSGRMPGSMASSFPSAGRWRCFLRRISAAS